MGSLSSTTNALASHLTSPKPNRNREKPADLNVRNVVLGDILFKAWYPSFYPEELVGRQLERLYVCPWCFKYSKELMPYLAHIVRIPLLLTIYVLTITGRNYALGKAPLHLIDSSIQETCTPSTKLMAKSIRQVLT